MNIFRIGTEVARSALLQVPVNIYRKLIPRDLIGFCYHVVSDEQLPHVRHLYHYKTPTIFEQDLSYL